MSRAKEATAAVGSVAPDFILHDTEGAEWQMSAHHGRVVVLLFYPGDATPVCTKQLCSVRDNWESYTETGAEVVGISTDTVESHRKFTDQHQLPLRLLADTEGKVHQAYDASSWFPGARRATPRSSRRFAPRKRTPEVSRGRCARAFIINRFSSKESF
jgi:peroxiredoxin Q/BCP